jgi:two-component system, chemotaxis family, protein-glutamate methylesterase/glutaminase
VSDPVRVLVVDDSAFVRRAVERMLTGVPGMTVVGTASDGAEAVEQTRILKPDVVIMDVNMPRLDGLEALRRIMAESPTRVLMLSTQTQEGARVTLNALELGAVDFVDKSAPGTSMDIYSLGPVLREKVLELAGAEPPPPIPDPEAEPIRVPPSGVAVAGDCEAALIGTSTGGPRALMEVLSRLPADFPVGVVIAQHMPPGFTRTLAERLDRRCALKVVEAEHGAEVVAGTVLIAPGGSQITLQRVNGGVRVSIDRDRSDLIHRPSVDLLFRSAAEVLGPRAIGVILTGMGEDGARGLAEMRQAGARTLVESGETAVIYGMPRAAAPAAERILPLREIGPAIDQISREARKSGEEGAA